jgi:hypothetical protein
VHENLFEKALLFTVSAYSERISLPPDTCFRRLWLTSIVLESWWSAETTPVPKLRMIVALSVDAVFFRPRVTITNDRSVGRLEDITQLENPDLFEQYLRNPTEFTTFLTKRWSQAYSALFAFQFQPILPSLPCCIVHAWPHYNRKGPECVAAMST